ncbi:MAG: YgjV family protein [Agathobacter sp.]|uniref:YgjV family protein n=1 Tax=Agathobacter sp. TaxID=2021311 RepID=UPI00258492E2|nr:YgjV family protein [Agathobacter sp.]MCR5676636.1 YgjV family protein [Agathobacter sp.]
MYYLVIGNIISFAGAIVMVLIGLIKERKKILSAQIAQFSLMGLGNLVLGGPTGFITNMVSIVRNLICFKWEFTWPLKIGFIVLQTVLAAIFNQNGLIGWFPVIGTAMFTFFMDTDSDITLKVIIILSEVLWCIFDFSVKNFSSLAFDVLTMISTTVGIIMILKERGNEKMDVLGENA